MPDPLMPDPGQSRFRLYWVLVQELGYCLVPFRHRLYLAYLQVSLDCFVDYLLVFQCLRCYCLCSDYW